MDTPKSSQDGSGQAGQADRMFQSLVDAYVEALDICAGPYIDTRLMAWLDVRYYRAAQYYRTMLAVQDGRA